MTRLISAAFLVSVLLFGGAYAQTAREQTASEPATVLSVRSHMMPGNPVGGVIDNTVPQPQEYIYDVEIRRNCDVYVARYESPTKQMPAAFAPNHTVNVRLDRHFMLFSPAESDQTVTTAIVSHERASGCATRD